MNWGGGRTKEYENRHVVRSPMKTDMRVLLLAAGGACWLDCPGILPACFAEDAAGASSLMAKPAPGAPAAKPVLTMPRHEMELREKARKELAAWLLDLGRWEKNVPRPGKKIDELPSAPPVLNRLDPLLDTPRLHGDAALPDQHWPEFLKRHPMTARQLRKSGIQALPHYGSMPEDNFPAFQQRLSSDLAMAFESKSPERRRQEALGIVVWMAVYADLLATRGDKNAGREAGELMQMLAETLCRFHNPALAKDMPLAPCLAFEIIWPGLPLCPADNLQKKEALVYAVDRAFQIGRGLPSPATAGQDWELAQLALCKWRLETRISRHDGELAARDLAYAYAAAGDHGRAIQYYHTATQINPESPRDYTPIIKTLMMKSLPRPEAEPHYLAYMKLLSRSGLASKGSTRTILRCRADECRKKELWEQAIGFLKAMDPHRWDPQTSKEISELEKKLQDNHKDKNIRTAGKGAST